MITEAIVLGDVEAAVYREDDSWRAVRLTPDNTGVIDCSGHLSLLLICGVEQRPLPEPLQDISELTKHLRVWARRHRALTMLLSGMDTQLRDDTRCTCIQVAERLLDDSNTIQFVRARLLGCPCPNEADLGGGIKLASESNASKAAQLYQQMQATGINFRIIRARKILDQILFSQSEAAPDPEGARRTIIDAGVIADAVLA
ncbi:MAG: hypothetical protein ACREBC_17340 [Pyrinomonadaceae bacterium]